MSARLNPFSARPANTACWSSPFKGSHVALATLLALPLAGTASAVDIGIVNGDFELDAADDVAPPTGWTDLTPTSFWTGLLDDPGNPTAAEGALAPAPGLGSYFLTTARTSAGAGSQPTDGTLLQTVDLTSFGTDIDTGGQFLYVDFIWASDDDRDTGTFTLDFFGSTDGTGTSLASYNLDLNNGDGFTFVGWFEETVGGAVPVSTRSVTLQIDTTRTGGSETNLWFDNFVGDISNTSLIFNVWSVDADGLWNTASNWSDGVPPADADVTFGNVISANRTVTLDTAVQANSIAFNNSGDGDYFLVDNGGGETLTLTGDAVVDLQTGRHWFRAVVAGTAGLNATGPGELVLDADNSFSGGITIDDANLAIVNVDAIPAGNDIALTNNAQLRFWGPDNEFFVTENGAPGYASGTVAEDISIDATSIVDVNSGADVTLTGSVTGTGLLASNSGATLTLPNASTFAGRVGAYGGDVVVNNNTALGLANGTPEAGTEIGGNADTGALVLTGGLTVGDELLTFGAREDDAADTVGLSSTGNNTWNGKILGAAGGTQYNLESTSGTLTLNGTISAPDTGERNFVFGGAGNFLVGEIIDGLVDANGDYTQPGTADNVNVVKRGAGTLTVDTQTDANDDYWFGTTTVEAGSLVVNSDGGDNGELRSTVTVNAGATFDVSDFGTYNLIPIASIEAGIGGGGTVVANTLGVFESSTVTPGDSVGTLNVNGNVLLRYFDTGDATVPDTGSFNFELGDNGATVGGAENDLIDISGSLTATIETAATGSQFVFNINPVEGALDESNNYTLITAGTRTGNATAANFTANLVDTQGNPLVTRQSASVVLVGNTVQLDVNGNPLNLTWTGNVNGDWDVNTTANWNSGAQTFFASDSATFNATGGGGAINVAETVAPANVTVTGADYSFSGADINAISVTVGGGATASFANTVRGNAVVQNTGTLAGTGTFGDSVTVQSGGTLRVGGDGLPTQDVLTYVDATDGVGGNTTLSAGGTFTPTTNPDWQIRTVFGNGGEVYQGDADNPNDAPELQTTITGLTPGQDYTVYANYWAAFTGSGVTQWRILAGSASGNLTLYDADFTDIAGATDGLDLSTVPYTNDPLVEEGNRTLWGAPVGTLTADSNGEISVFVDDTGTADGDDRTWYDGVSYSSGAIAPASATMTIDGDLTLNAGSTLSLDIASPTILDSLIVGGTLNAGGTLDVNLEPGETLEAGDAFDLLDFASATGSFAFDLPTLTTGLTWDTSSILIDGILSVLGPAGIFGDYNDSGQVEQGDLDFVLQNWGDTDISDVAGWVNFAGLPGGGIDGQVEQTELDLVLTNWGDTTAPDFAGSSVPEPTSLVILGLSGALALRRRP